MLDEMRHFKYITKVKLGKEYWFRGNQWLLSFNREQMAPPGCKKKEMLCYEFVLKSNQ